jgi:membrane peptidoglycan carboxypeptidase
MSMRYLAWSIALGGVVCAAAGLTLVAVVYYQVYFGDDSNLKKSTIVARINEETPVFYNDEKTSMGSFFGASHRRYVTIDEMPGHLLNAVVAAEDKNFFHHRGVDFVAIASAFKDGLLSGRFRRGASSITQQTVKNILDRREKTFTRKFREMIAALQIERMYSKKQILEFYLNQFGVAANGSGIYVAARYYFNKEVRDLDLIESAFIAGSVKGPSKYTPFIKSSRDEQEKAKGFAAERKNYVLRRMYEQGWISDAELKEAWDKPVPFDRGEFRTSEVALIDIIRQQMRRKDVMAALNMESEEELNYAGLKIFTTLDQGMQEDGQLAMRRNLSRIETILQGFKAESVEDFKPMRDLEPNMFYFAKVESVNRDEKEPEIQVTFGLPTGRVPADSLMRYAKMMDAAQGRTWEVQRKELLKNIRVGDVLYVEVKEYDKAKNDAVCELQKRPVVNGGLVALDKGEVRAAIPGFDSLGFNRAIHAQRQPGSVFKAVVYFAGLQLGWTVLDRLDNERQIFPFQGRFYYPRADHPSPFKDVSMVWAGTMSENIASVYLTTRLLDKLNFEEFRQLLALMDLLPHTGETPPDYHFRVARETGVQLDNEGVRELQLRNAVEDVGPDLVFAGDDSLLRRLRKMWWGTGYESELKALATMDEKEFGAIEKHTRMDLVKNNWLRLGNINQQLAQDWTAVQERVAAEGADGIFSDKAVGPLVSRFRVLPSTGKPELGYFFRPSEDGPSTETSGGRPMNLLDVQAVWGGGGVLGSQSRAGISMSDVRLDGWLSVGTYARLQSAIKDRYDQVMAQEDAWDLPRYYQHHDFRLILGLKYLVALTKAMGVNSPLEPVLSFPLGTNPVSAVEVAKIYQTFATGKVYRFFEEGAPNQVNFIKRVEDRYGNILYEAKRLEVQIVDPVYAAGMREILRKVVTNGTGRLAHTELYVTETPPEGAPTPVPEKKTKVLRVRVPSFGKTGTTNDFTTAYYAGFMPYPVSKSAPLDPENSFTIAAWVGYDRNRIMRRGGFRVYGGVGALPLWTGFAKETLVHAKYADFVDPLDIKVVTMHEWPMRQTDDFSMVRVDLPRGQVLGGNEDGGEDGGMTDISRTGESFVSEFAVGNNVHAMVRVPRASGDEFVAQRMVRFFNIDLLKGDVNELFQASPSAASQENSEKAEASDAPKTPAPPSADEVPVRIDAIPETPVDERERSEGGFNEEQSW